MTEEHINNILAEYMGDIFYHNNGARDLKDSYYDGKYTKSLDNLLKVFQKMKKDKILSWFRFEFDDAIPNENCEVTVISYETSEGLRLEHNCNDIKLLLAESLANVILNSKE